MKYVIGTKNRGLVLSPDRIWDGNKNFKFHIHGRTDSDYATNKDDQKSIDECFWSGVLSLLGSMQKFITLSVTEAKSAAGAMIAKDMLNVYRLLLSLELQVELPLILEMDNKGEVDLANNCSIGGCTRHVDMRNFFLCEVKDKGILVIKHVPCEENYAHIFMKNTLAQVFERHVPKFVRHDKKLRAQT